MKGELKKTALEDLRQKVKKRRRNTEKAETRGKIEVLFELRQELPTAK
jgi:hypothetical protein